MAKKYRTTTKEVGGIVLTLQEIELIKLIAQGISRDHAAAALGMTRGNVNNLWFRSFSKIGYKKAALVARWAESVGLVPPLKRIGPKKVANG